ncbi:pitrilysin family protein [Lewinella sp. W8]|uniref:M16 family metallopeptidase n=1 Tax=Lewinella sp. W8 TaxID=2528208 RepID=UPI0010682CED|nr:pitrilysin family protein [Lewinella sp. W8]MTB53540.1 insulinase family protein [Lewinella sp. W8]
MKSFATWLFCLLLCTCALAPSCSTEDRTSPEVASQELSIPFEKFTLGNGLEVVMHVDESDPLVAVTLTAHVGSAREKEERTGFAHLFEHLLFLESENLGKGGLDAMSARIGGSGANGSTNRDRTNYFQTVPKNALEKMIWAEADKLGWFINTVTEPVLAKEKQVVKNEKRQGVDNRPYGHNNYVIDKHLYPSDHPYNWQVIGSLEDLDKATLADVKEFFRRWYVPNNVTLSISGDFDPDQAREWVEKYFAEIPAGEEVEDMAPRPSNLSETVRLYYPDNFARLPQLTLAWPGVELYHPDAYALEVLMDYLTVGKGAPMNQVLVEDLALAPNVFGGSSNSELAGDVALQVQAFPGKDLDSVLVGIETAMRRFEAEPISERDLQRILSGKETAFYNRLSSALGKGFSLAQYNIFAGDPAFVEQDIKNILGVTTEDVVRVYEKYLKGKPYVATSFVPRGQEELALENSQLAEVVEESIEQGAEESFDASLAAEYEPTPSSFDRSQEPPYGAEISITPPGVWEEEASNGLRIFGIENREVPLVDFEIQLRGGQLLEQLDKTGVARLTALLMERGTANKTPAELEAAIEMLGADIDLFAGKESLTIRGNTLARNYPATMALVTEMLLEPRWDKEELELLRSETLSSLERQQASPNAIAGQEFDKLLYGEDNIRAYSTLGTPESVAAITVEDLRAYYRQYFSPSVATLHVVGALDQEAVMEPLTELINRWEAKPVAIPDWPLPEPPAQAKVYFYDVPNAKQSVLRIGRPGPTFVDNDYYPAQVMNYILGGGGFASRLMQELRESKGYTYGIRSGFSGTRDAGEFSISSGVRSNVTLESLTAVREILEEYPETFSEQDLETTRSFLLKSNARAFETAGAKLRMLRDMSQYGLSANYLNERADVVRDMSQQRISQLAQQYANPNEMIWLVVGDAATQLERTKALGFGEPILLNP